MLAVVKEHEGPGFAVKEVPYPVLRDTDVIIKVRSVGICGTDVEFYQAGAVPPFVQLPMVLGHENVGTVVEVGEGVTDYKVGDQILCGPPSHCAEDCPPAG